LSPAIDLANESPPRLSARQYPCLITHQLQLAQLFIMLASFADGAKHRHPTIAVILTNSICSYPTQS
ncbi:hypothetical protein PTTG_30285, partial [Puccinia triticina 1-1 BBBD Race 1]